MRGGSGPGVRRGVRSSFAFDVGDRLADGGLVDDRFLGDGAGHQGGGADLVDAAGQALGVVKDARDRVVGKEGACREAGNLDVVADVADRLVQIERREMIADGETLVEGLVDGEPQGGAQGGVTDEQQSSERLGVHLGGEEETELFEHRLSEEMSLVDDDQGGAALGGAEVVEGGADGADLARGGIGRPVAEVDQKLPVEARDAGGRVGEVDDEVAVGVEGGGEGAHSGRLAGAELAGDEAKALLADEEGETGGEFFLTDGVEEVGGGDRPGKGQPGEAVELLEHS